MERVFVSSVTLELDFLREQLSSLRTQARRASSTALEKRSLEVPIRVLESILNVPTRIKIGSITCEIITADEAQMALYWAALEESCDYLCRHVAFADVQATRECYEQYVLLIKQRLL